LLAFHERRAQRSKLRFLFFEQPQPRAHNIACVAVAALPHLRLNELNEVLADAERRVFVYYEKLSIRYDTKLWYNRKRVFGQLPVAECLPDSIKLLVLCPINKFTDTLEFSEY